MRVFRKMILTFGLQSLYEMTFAVQFWSKIRLKNILRSYEIDRYPYSLQLLIKKKLNATHENGNKLNRSVEDKS